MWIRKILGLFLSAVFSFSAFIMPAFAETMSPDSSGGISPAYQNASKVNSTFVAVKGSISHDAPIEKFTIFSAHTSWCSSGEILEEYTTSNN